MESLNRRIAQQSPVTAKEEDTASVSLPSFSSMDDEDIAASLRRSITDVAVGRSVDEDTAPMTAEELRALIYNKYSKTHDVSFVRRDIPGKSIGQWPQRHLTQLSHSL